MAKDKKYDERHRAVSDLSKALAKDSADAGGVKLSAHVEPVPDGDPRDDAVDQEQTFRIGLEEEVVQGEKNGSDSRRT